MQITNANITYPALVTTFSVGFSKNRNNFDDLKLSVLGAVAQFERAMIGERQREGIALAKKRGVYNAKVKKRKLSDSQISDIKVKLGQGLPKSRVAKDFGPHRKRFISA